MYITGNVDLGGTFGATAGTDLNYVLGTYYSLFSRQVVSSNGKQLETIERPGELVNMILNQTLNPAEKRGLANTLGYYNDIAGTVAGELDATYNICQAINTGAASNILLGNNGKSFTFALPIIGLLNANKMLPLFNGDWTVELTVNDIRNWLVGKTVLANAAIPNITFSISNLELVFDQLTLTPESFAMVMQNYPEKMYIKSQSYDFGSAASFTVTPSALDIPVNVKRSSLKQILLYFTQADLVDKTFGGVNPNINDIVFITNGNQYPQRPIRVNINPSEVWSQVSKSWGSMYSNSHSGCMGKMEFCRRTTGSNNYYGALVTGAAADADYGQIITASNKFYMAIDTELINFDSDSLYSGIPMGVNSNFRVNIGGLTTTSVCTPMFWFCYDSIIEFDLINSINSVIC
jgi:hypothetical protein